MKRKRVVRYLFFMGVLLCSLAWAGSGNDLVLKSRATVSGDLVKIKDIALMDKTMENRIGSLVVAVSPELGQTASLQKQEIYEKLVGNGLENPRLKGADHVVVVRKGMIVEPDFFRDKIRDYVMAHSRWKGGVQVEIVTAKAIAVPESGVRWQLIPANGQDFFGNILFKVRAFSGSGSEEIYSNWIVAKLKIIKPVAVSNRVIQKNETITDSDVRWESRQIDAFTRDALLHRDEIIGQKAGRIIRPNSVITGKLLAAKYLVRRGGTATLVAHLKGIKATSTVQVLGNGGYGDNVRVVNTQSKKIISAVVTGENILEVTVR